MKEKMTVMEQTCAQMASQMAAMMSMMSSMHRGAPNKNVPDMVGFLNNVFLPSSGVLLYFEARIMIKSDVFFFATDCQHLRCFRPVIASASANHAIS